MDNRILPSRPDVVTVQTAPRPTPTPARVQFSEVLAGGAEALVRGAEAAVSVLPGGPLAAVALRGGVSGTAGSGAAGLSGLGSVPSVVSSATLAPEGPGGTPTSSALASLGSATTGGTTGGTSGTGDTSLESSMAQSEQMNMYYLQVQEEVNAQNRAFTALSNVLEVEHSTAKSAIGNIH
jgi:hypothetical protein